MVPMSVIPVSTLFQSASTFKSAPHRNGPGPVRRISTLSRSVSTLKVRGRPGADQGPVVSTPPSRASTLKVAQLLALRELRSDVATPLSSSGLQISVHLLSLPLRKQKDGPLFTEPPTSRAQLEPAPLTRALSQRAW